MRLRIAAWATLLCHLPVYAQGPRPPCGQETVPSYPALDDDAAVKSWSRSDFGRDWKPPACTGWTAEGFTTLISTAARFRINADADGLFRRVGAISDLTGVRYWSTTHRQWRTLIVEAHALTSAAGKRRDDFMPSELQTGAVLYFEQTDNLSGKAIYRLHVAEASKDRLVFDVENVSTMKYLLVPLFHAGEMQSIYFLDREPENVWRYYSIVRTSKNASGLTAGNEASSINRAVAFYRHLAGIPTDREPPAAR